MDNTDKYKGNSKLSPSVQLTVGLLTTPGNQEGVENPF
jgi:hypothetical protein